MESLKTVKEIDKEIRKISLISSPGPIMLGLSLYSIFEAKGNAFLPILNNMQVVYGMLTLGAVICVWELKKISILSKLRAELTRKDNT